MNVWFYFLIGRRYGMSKDENSDKVKELARCMASTRNIPS